MHVLRPYRDDDDFWKMRRFLQSRWSDNGPACGLFHVGDITWQRFMYTRDVFPPEERIVLAERSDGDIDGFAWYYPKWTEVAFQIDPQLQETAGWRVVADAMLAWGDERHASDTTAVAPLSIAEFETDTVFADYIKERGFARNETPPMRFHRRSLAIPIPEPDLPDGFVVRPITGEAELEQRVEIHREVWNPSRFTVPGYRQLRASPGYDPELDLVAVAPDGAFAAYAICWHDEVSGSGEFEPVGAREAFRGRGLTKAVMWEAMRRLKSRGCRYAFVNTNDDRTPAVNLYRSLGFDVINRWVYYQRMAEKPNE